MNLVGYLHRCTKMMHGHTDIKFLRFWGCYLHKSLWSGLLFFFYSFACNRQIEYENKILRHSRTPLFGTLINRIANYPNPLSPSGKFVENLQHKLALKLPVIGSSTV